MTTTEIKCRWCQSANYRRVGIRKLVNRKKQILYCKDCHRKFDLEISRSIEDSPTAGPRKTYSQNWPAYNEAQMGEKNALIQFLTELCYRFEWKKSTGRPSVPLPDLLASCCLKNYLNVSARRLNSELETLQKQELIDVVPHYNTLLRSLQKKSIQPYLEELLVLSAYPLGVVDGTFAVDSTGFSTSNYARWFDKRFGKDKTERVWVKGHALCGTKTNMVARLIVTEGHQADSPMFLPLFNQAVNDFSIKEVVADKAYSARANINAVVQNGGQVFIPFKNNASGKTRGCRAWSQAYKYFFANQQEFYEHYHQRSNVESTFSMLKRKFGVYLREKKFQGQVNELYCRAIVHNLCVLNHEMHDLGINPWPSWDKKQVLSIASNLYRQKEDEVSASKGSNLPLNATESAP